MTKPIDILAMGPKREAMKLAAGWRVRVTPPAWSQFTPSTVDLTDDQFSRFGVWLREGGLIQVLLPELSDDEREILVSGINPQQWEEAFGNESDT